MRGARGFIEPLLGVFLCASIPCLWKYSECLRTLLDSLAESTSFSGAVVRYLREHMGAHARADANVALRVRVLLRAQRAAPAGE